MIEVIVADDHPLVVEGLKKVLKQEGFDTNVIGEAANAGELINLLKEKLPDLVILDIAMPGKSGLDALKEIKEEYPNLPVLILSMHPEDRYAIRSLKAGASGYLTKGSIPDQLVKAIEKIVVDKKRYISPEVAEQLAMQVDSTSNRQPHEILSDREYQVLCMIASGKKVSEIAKELFLSVHTVHTYRARVMEKMNMESDVQLTHYAIENNLVD